MAIAFLYEQLSAPENTKYDLWSVVGARHCITAIIKQNLFLAPGTDITTVLVEYLECRAAGLPYYGARSVSDGKSMGRPTKNSSVKAQICANTQ
jgi:hypothetical protein